MQVTVVLLKPSAVRRYLGEVITRFEKRDTNCGDEDALFIDEMVQNIMHIWPTTFFGRIKSQWQVSSGYGFKGVEVINVVRQRPASPAGEAA